MKRVQWGHAQWGHDILMSAGRADGRRTLILMNNNAENKLFQQNLTLMETLL